ncbi:hypothetical protein BD410DRAFT_784505 [Rickenella mellea]|uniref:F-box domain-containing protein n=1 Tax=Rickenella mellea TaxID=50990 RepID=A0A4Y7QE31_9AGAM|nr:hypothetical protein BD410DRAFT_784505 [Rickenella mellea]
MDIVTQKPYSAKRVVHWKKFSIRRRKTLKAEFLPKPQFLPSHAQTLIPDLLTLVFHQCMELEFVWGLPRPSRNAAPLKLGMVCRSWRQVALSTSKLWASIQITSQCSPSVLRQWLDRSRSSPLSIRWIFHEEVHDLCEIAAIVSAHSYHWKNVTLRIPGSCLKKVLAPLSRAQGTVGAPMLEMLSVTLPGGGSFWTNGVTDPATLDIRNAPQLKVLSLGGTKLPVTMGDSTHSTIRELRSSMWYIPGRGPFSSDMWLSILSRCPNVTTVHANIDSMSFLPFRCDILELPIEDFSVALSEGLSHRILDTLLDKLRLSDLSRLALEVNSPRLSLPSWPYLMKFIKQSQRPLLSLSLRGIPISEHHLLECLSMTTELEILELSNMNITDEFLDRFRHFGDEPCSRPTLCRRLQSIKLECSLVHFTMPVVTDMVVTRWYIGNKVLRRIELDYCGLTEGCCGPEIFDCVRDGLHLSIRHFLFDHDIGLLKPHIIIDFSPLVVSVLQKCYSLQRRVTICTITVAYDSEFQ